jgi:hypothetical protein
MPVVFSNVQQVVGGDAIKPGAELCLAAEAGERVDGFEKNLLRSVFGVGAAVQHA